MSGKTPRTPLLEDGDDSKKRRNNVDCVKVTLYVAGGLVALVMLGLLITTTVLSGLTLSEVSSDSSSSSSTSFPPVIYSDSVSGDTVSTQATAPTTLATFCVKKTGVVSFCNMKSASTPCYVPVRDITIGDSTFVATDSSAINITILKRNYYTVNLLAFVTRGGCPAKTMSIVAVERVNSTNLTTMILDGFTGRNTSFSKILFAGSKLSFFIPSHTSLADASIEIYGTITKTTDLDEIDSVTAQDKALKVKWIPSRPAGIPASFPAQFPTSSSVYLWNATTIPADIVPGSLPAGVPDADGYAKFQSVQYSIGAFMGLDMNTLPGTDPQVSLFIKNKEHRGENNRLKHVYMYALDSGKMKYYEPKIDAMINSLLNDWTVYHRPVLSSYSDRLLTFFLDIHLGEAEHPHVVREYFRLFMNVIAFGDPDRPERDPAVLYGYNNVNAVRAYVRQRLDLVLAQQDKSTIIYHWHAAGFDVVAVLMEAIHNIVAFSQYVNVMYLTAIDQISGTVTGISSPAVIKYDFLGRFANTTDPVHELNIVRELYRLTVPNGVSFSRVRRASTAVQPGAVVQSRHLHKPIMVQAHAINAVLNGVPANQAAGAYFAFNTAQYGAFNTSFQETNCPAEIPEGEGKFFNVSERFEVSSVDGETVVDKCNPKIFNVAPLPMWVDHGFGYRACAGKVLNYFFGVKSMRAFSKLKFVFKSIPAGTPLVTLAPFSVAQDNIFVQV